jgi:hypothetical protein
VPDRTSQLLLTALSRAAAEPRGVPLHPSRGSPGLFPATAAGRQAAQRSAADGYLRPALAPALVAVAAGPEKASRRLKAPPEPHVLTDKGLAFLLAQTSPRPVLEDVVRALEARHEQAVGLLTSARQMLSELSALRAVAEKVLERVREPGYVWPAESDDREAGPSDWGTLLADLLTRHEQASVSGGDCPLPDLYHRAREAVPAMTVGGFHDALRRLSDDGLVYLHPWTGPIHEIPEPAYALLVGHMVAYYASVRS